MSKKFFSCKWILAFISVLFLAKCKVPYDPQINGSKDHYLIVEGFINPGGVTNIKLSRTRNITFGDTAAYINETGAKVFIEDNNTNLYPLFEAGSGNYSGNFNLDPNLKYSLHITTSDNKEYLSDFVSCKQSPPIDTIGWNLKDQNVHIFVNTHDPNNGTHFYRWSYSQTWEFHSQYYSNWVFVPFDSTVVRRTIPVDVCYRTENSSNIILGSSAKLQQDVIYESPIVLIPFHDRRLSVLYSILVTQYALDSAAYNYWTAMKSNTENVGSLFDPQPNQTKGNIHSVSDPSELVIGYIGAGTTQQERIFISNFSLPSNWNQLPICFEQVVPNNKDSLEKSFSDNSLVPYSENPPGAFIIKSFNAASGSCVDCTVAGGSLDKPNFWP